MPGRPDRRGHLLVQRGADQRVPEGQAIAGFDQHASRAGLVHRRDQLDHAPAEHGGQVRHREVDAEQGGGAEHLAHPAGHEAEPVGDGLGQRVRRRVAGQLGDPASVMVRPALRVSASISSVTYSGLPAAPSASSSSSPAGLPPASAVDQVGHRRPVRPSSCSAGGQFGGVPEREQVLALGYRPHHADQQQRPVPGRPGQPLPQADAGLIRPLEVIDDQNGGLGGTQFVDQGEQLFGQRGGHVLATPGAGVRRAAALRSFPAVGWEWAPGSAIHPGMATVVTSAPAHHRRPRTPGSPAARLPCRRHGRARSCRFLAHPRSARPGPGPRRPRARSQ